MYNQLEQNNLLEHLCSNYNYFVQVRSFDKYIIIELILLYCSKI